MIKKNIKILFSIVIFFTLNFPTECREVVVVASGDTHAALKKSFALDSLRNENTLLLLDEGGFSAGGLYDIETGGFQYDSIRTFRAIQTLSKLGYDAIGLGDEELQYNYDWLKSTFETNKLRVVSANCFDTLGNLCFDPFVVIKKNGIKFVVTSLVTKEKLFKHNAYYSVENPMISFTKIYLRMKSAGDVLVLLSHLGEAELATIIENFPDINVAVNGHRKTTQVSGYKVEKTDVMQFSYQGKKFSLLSSDNGSTFTQYDWINNGDDDTVNILDNSKDVIKKEIYDIYIMSLCPYGLPALSNLLKYYEDFASAKIKYNIYFIGDINADGTLKSLRGQKEIDDELMWLSVFANYPEYKNEFVYMCTTEKLSSKNAIETLGLDIDKINSWIKNSGKEMLKMHYDRSTRLRVNASPTLIINNKPYDSEISTIALRSFQCKKNSLKNAKAFKCDSLPECITDNMCSKKGFFGKCVKDSLGWGSCEYEKDVEFIFSIVTSKNIRFKTENDFVSTTKDLFPSAKINYIQDTSALGAQLLGHYKTDLLPLFIFSKDVEKAKNFLEINKGLTKIDSSYVFNANFIKGTYYFKNPLTPHRVDIYINPIVLSSDKENIDSLLIIISRFNKDGENYLYFTEKPTKEIETLFTTGLKRTNFIYVQYSDSVKKKVSILGISNEAFTILIENREVVNLKNFSEAKYLFKDAKLQ